jgi:hypothetical protein
MEAAGQLKQWGFYLDTQMLNHLLKPTSLITFGGRKFDFQRDPADYDAEGQLFLKRAKKNELILFGWIGLGVAAVVVNHIYQ